MAAHPSSTRRSRRLPQALLGGCLVVLLLGLLPALPAHPKVVFDELGYLGTARWLSGRAPIPDFTGNYFVEPGYPLLISPAWWPGISPPEAVYRRVQAIDALLLALLPLPLHVLLRRLGAARRAALAGAIGGALAPAMLVQVRYAMPEVAFAIFLTLAMLAAERWARRRTATTAAMAGAAAAALVWIHPRGGAVALAMAAWALILVARRRVAITQLGAFAAALALGWVALGALERHLIAIAYHLDTRHRIGGMLLAKLADAGIVLSWPRAAWGQVWYLIASTLGLTLVGGALLVGRLAARPVRRRDDRWPLPLLVALSFLAVLAISSLHMAPVASVTLDQQHVENADSRLYGRYVESFLPLLLGLGIVAALRARGSRSLVRAAGLVLAGGVVLALAWRGEPLRGEVIPDNVLGLAPFLTSDRFCLGAVPIGAITAGATLLLAAGRAIGRRTALAIAALLGVVVLARGLEVTASRRELPSELARWVERLGARELATDAAAPIVALRPYYQYLLPRVRFTSYDSRRGERPTAPLAIAAHEVPPWPDGVFVWREGGPSLWVRPALLRGHRAPFDGRDALIGAEQVAWVWRAGIGPPAVTAVGDVAALGAGTRFIVPVHGAPPVAVRLALASSFARAVPLEVRADGETVARELVAPGEAEVTARLPPATGERVAFDISSPPPDGHQAVYLRALALAESQQQLPPAPASVTARGAIVRGDDRSWPRLLHCRDRVAVVLRLRNDGDTAWPAQADGAEVRLRWLLGSTPVREERLVLPLAVLPHRALALRVALDPTGLLRGGYAVVAELTRSGKTVAGVAPLRTPVDVGDRFSLCGCR